MGIAIAGHWWILTYYIFILLCFNIAGEELWWRGYILPRQEAASGKIASLMHGLLWAAFHLKSVLKETTVRIVATPLLHLPKMISRTPSQCRAAIVRSGTTRQNVKLKERELDHQTARCACLCPSTAR